MQRKKIFLFLLLAAGIFACSKGVDKNAALSFNRPSYFPEPVYKFENNPLTEKGFALGLKLFYDPILSADNTISCASCHIQTSAFSHHGHAFSHGIYNQTGTRNAPGLMNLAWASSFMQDGGIFDLDLQPIAPITNPVEMDETVEHVLEKLRATSYYPQLFKDAFGDASITTSDFLKALSQFMVSCVSSNAKYDSVKRGEAAFTAEEQRGYTVFQQHCNNCHTEPLFTDYSFRNNGVPINPGLNDIGRGAVTLNPSDNYKFKVPTLRNLDYTPPYMHDGSMGSIDAVMAHYTFLMRNTPNLDPLFYRPGDDPGITLTIEEQNDLKAFLKTLNDYSYLVDKRLAPE